MVEQQDNDRIKGHSFLIDNILRREDNSPGTDTTAEIALITVHREQSSKVTQNIVAFPTELNENSPRLTDIQGLCGCPDNNTDTSPECQLKLRHKKKTRTVFSRHQIFYLESAFEMKRYLSSTERSEMARSLKLTETQVKVWFQNRRNKWKSQMSGQDSYSPEPPLFTAYSPFPTDPRLQQRLAMLHNMPPLFY